MELNNEMKISDDEVGEATGGCGEGTTCEYCSRFFADSQAYHNHVTDCYIAYFKNSAGFIPDDDTIIIDGRPMSLEEYWNARMR